MRTRTRAFIAGIVVLGILTARPAFAQGQARNPDDVSGDLAFSFSVLHDSAPMTFPAGFILSLGLDLNKKVRLVMEFGGNYKTVHDAALGINLSREVLSYMGGVRFAPGGKAKARPFLQVLAGDARASATLLGVGTSASNNGFAAQLGGGVDFRMNDRFDGRIQFDERGIRSHGATSSEYRIAFGIVFPFGR